MKILVVGGGPAGLYFSYLLKKRQPAHRIHVVERDPRGATYGWGVVFSGGALQAIKKADDEFYADFIREQTSCEYLEVVHRQQGVRVYGNQFSRTPRRELLRKLEVACEQVGVTQEWNRDLALEDIDDSWDLVVIANGNDSELRARFEQSFGTRIQTRRNLFAWYGTRALFHPVSLIFVPTEHGTFIAHCYQFSRSHSTFLVECSPQTWTSAGLDRMTDHESRDFCSKVFADELDGEPLLSNRSEWFRADIVSNKRACHDRFVLIGDAYRTVHFSLGSGTRLAMEDAMALCEAVAVAGKDAQAALQAFEYCRQSTSAEFQAAAARSLDWYESVDSRLDLSPLAFTYDYMIRTGKVSREDLRQMDPAFVAAYKQEQQQPRNNSAAKDGLAGQAGSREP